MPLRFDPHFTVPLRSASHGPPPYAPPTANRDEPSDGIISVTTPDSAPPLVPLQSEHERLLQHRPAVTTLNHPLARRHGPHRRPCARCAPPPARPAARVARYTYDASSGRPASPSGRVVRRTGRAPRPLADGRNHRGGTLGGPRPRGLGGACGRCRRYAVPMGPRRAARGRYFVRVTKIRAASGGRSTSSLRHDLTGPWLDHHALPHITLYDPRPLGRAASPRTPCGKPRRAVGPNRRFGGEWRAMVYYYMVCDHTTHPTCTATTTPPTPASLVHTRLAPGFEPRKMSQQPPPPPPERVQVEGAFFALGVSE